MKSVRILKLAIPALLFVSASASADIATTAHDMSGDNAVDNGQVCVYCHTPHRASSAIAAPLWNKLAGQAAGDFTLYPSGGSMDATVNEPGPKSLACLSCHDGTVTYDNIQNAPGLTTPSFGGAATMIGSNGLVGTSLADDHPIGVEATDPDITVGTLATYLDNSRVECSTCHDVHNAGGFDSFLRIDNAASALCADCHSK